MDIKNILKAVGYAIVGAFIGVIISSLQYSQKIDAHRGRKYEAIYTVTNYKTETNYYKITKADLLKITNVLDITNLTYIKNSNFYTITNRLTVTNVVTILEDYLGFWESPFIFSQTNNLITVQLYKRQSEFKITPPSRPRHAIAVYFPLMASYQFAPFADDVGLLGSATIGGYAGFVNSNFIFGLGLGFQF